MVTKKKNLKKVFFYILLFLLRPHEAMDSPKILLNEVYTGNQKVGFQFRLFDI